MRERKKRGIVGRGRKRDGSLLGGQSHHLMTVALHNPAAGFWCPHKLSFFSPTTTIASGGHRRCLPFHVMALQMWWGNFFNNQGKKRMRQIQSEGHNTVLVSFSQLYLTAAIKSLAYLKTLKEEEIECLRLFKGWLCLSFSLYYNI